MADPVSTAAVIAAIVSTLDTLSGLFGGGDTTINQEPAPLVGGGAGGVLPGLEGLADPLGGLNQSAPLGDIATLLGVLGGDPGILGPVTEAGAAAQQAKTAAEGAVGNVGEVSAEVPGTSKQEKGQKKKVATPKKGPSIGDILAAIPDALLAANAFGGPEGVSTQRAAPVAGSAQGGLVGQFRPPPPLDIGRLLASLPGIRV